MVKPGDPHNTWPTYLPVVISNSGEEHNLPFNDIKKEWIIEEEAPTIIVFGFFHLVSLVQNKISKSKHVGERRRQAHYICITCENSFRKKNQSLLAAVTIAKADPQ